MTDNADPTKAVSVFDATVNTTFESIINGHISAFPDDLALQSASGQATLKTLNGLKWATFGVGAIVAYETAPDGEKEIRTAQYFTEWGMASGAGALVLGGAATIGTAGAITVGAVLAPIVVAGAGLYFTFSDNDIIGIDTTFNSFADNGVIETLGIATDFYGRQISNVFNVTQSEVTAIDNGIQIGRVRVDANSKITEIEISKGDVDATINFEAGTYAVSNGTQSESGLLTDANPSATLTALVNELADNVNVDLRLENPNADIRDAIPQSTGVGSSEDVAVVDVDGDKILATSQISIGQNRIQTENVTIEKLSDGSQYYKIDNPLTGQFKGIIINPDGSKVLWYPDINEPSSYKAVTFGGLNDAGLTLLEKGILQQTLQEIWQDVRTNGAEMVRQHPELLDDLLAIEGISPEFTAEIEQWVEEGRAGLADQNGIYDVTPDTSAHSAAGTVTYQVKTLGSGPIYGPLQISDSDLVYLAQNASDNMADLRVSAFWELHARAVANGTVSTNAAGNVQYDLPSGVYLEVVNTGDSSKTVELIKQQGVTKPVGVVTAYADHFQQQVVEILDSDTNSVIVEITTTDESLNQAFTGGTVTLKYPEEFVFSEVGGYVGNIIGQQLADGDIYKSVLYSSALKTLGQNSGTVLDFLANGTETLDSVFAGIFGADTNTVQTGVQARPDLFEGFVKNLQSGVASAIGSAIVGELGDTVDIGGIGGEIFDVTAGTITTGIVSEGIGILFNQLEGTFYPGLLSNGFDFATPFYDPSLPGGGVPEGQVGPPAPNTTVGDYIQAQVFSAVAAYAGARLAGDIIEPESEVAALFGSAGSALGTAISTGAILSGNAIATVFQGIGWAGGPVGAVVGAFVGTVLGTVIGNAFGGGEETPSSWGRVSYDTTTHDYHIFNVWENGDAGTAIGQSLAQQVVDGVNAILAATHGTLRKGAVAQEIQIGMEGNAFNVLFSGGESKSFGTGADAVNYAAFKLLKSYDLVGGHMVVMRAWHNSDATNIFEFKDDIDVAEAFQAYLANPTGILAMMMDQPDSDTAQAWAAVLQRAAELELHLPHEKDLDGGWGEILSAQGVDPSLIPSLEGDTITLTDPVTGEETVIHHVIGPGYEIVRIEGTDGNDIIEVNVDGSSITYVAAGDGNDTIEGSDQSDILYGGGGDDIINGNDGNDWLHGGSGSDHIDGGLGEDLIIGAEHNDTLIGGDNIDEIYGNDGDDYLDPGMGTADYLFGGEGNDTIEGNVNHGMARIQLDNALMGTNAFTISMTFKNFNSLNDDKLFHYATENSHDAVKLYNNSSSVKITIDGQVIDTGYSGFQGLDWHTVTLTWDGASGQAHMYDANQLVWSYQYTGNNSIDTGGVLMIGQFQDWLGGTNGTYDFEGEISAFTVWDRVVDATEIANGSNHSDAIHDFDFSQGQGNSLPDLAGNGDAKIIGEFDWDIPEISNFVKLNSGSDNTGYARLDNAVIGTNAMTVSMGFKNDTPGEDDMLFHYATASQLGAFKLYNNPGGAYLQIGGQDVATGYTGLQDDAWHDLTISWDGASGLVKMYDNGQEVWSHTYNADVTLDSNGVLMIGAYQESYGVQSSMFDFEGSLASFTMWDEALSGTEILNGVDHSDALHNYKFNTGTGTTVSDLAGNGDISLVGDYEWPVQAVPQHALSLNANGNTSVMTNAYLYGEAGDDHLIYYDHDTGNGGQGDDLIEFAGSSSTAHITRGEGHDTVIASTPNVNAIRFDATISPNELFFKQDGDDLKILVLGEDQSLTVQNFFGAINVPNVMIQALDAAAILYTRQDILDLVALHATLPAAPSGQYNYLSDTDLAAMQGNPYSIWTMANSSFGGDAGSQTFILGPGTAYGMGGAGNDTIRTTDFEPGNRVYAGDSGDDYLSGEGGQIDIMSGGLGNDTLLGFSGNDVLYGGHGDDFLDGGFDDDEIHGGEGADTIYGNGQSDRIYGDDGDDYIEDYDGANTIHGGAGNDIIDTSDNTDNDSIYGDEGNDTISAGSGDDTIHGGSGSDSVDGGAGQDWIYGGDGDDRISGDDGDDIISGGSGDNTLLGGAGNDKIYGGQQNDILNGGYGDDSLQGDSGDDFYYYDGLERYVTLNPLGGTGRVQLDNAAMGTNAFTISMTFRNLNDVSDDKLFHYATLGSHDSIRFYNNPSSVWLNIDGELVDTGYGGFQGTEWQTVTLSWDGASGVVKMYDDGQLVWTHQYAANNTLDSGGILMIGQYQDSYGSTNGNYDFEGDVSHFTIWDHVLGDTEISSGVDRSDALHNFNFANGQGSTVTNLAGNGDAALVGDYEWNDAVSADAQYFANIGTDTILDTSGQDTISFGNQIALSDLTFERDMADPDNLQIKLSGAHILTVNNHFNGGEIERLLFADGSSVSLKDVDVSIFGGTGNDIIGGTDQNDVISGGDGDDVLTGASGNDVLDGGDGNDEAVFGGVYGNYTLSGSTITDNVGTDGTDTLISIERLVFADGVYENGVFVPTGGSANTAPVAGDDSYSGEQDTPITGNVLGNDSDTDGDALSVTAQTIATAHGSVELLANGNFTYTPDAGYVGADSFTYTLEDGHGGSDTGTVSLTLNAFSGIVGTSGNDNMTGTTGDDVIHGLAGNDFLSGEEGNDILKGEEGDDTLKGRDGDDVMYGGDGVDYLEGNNGNDILYGGLGADTLKGSADVDTFAYLSAAEGGDTIVDFNPGGGEKIDLTAVLSSAPGFVDANAFTDGYLRVAQNGTAVDLYLDMDGSAGAGAETLLAMLQGRSVSDITLSAFILPTSGGASNTAPVAANDSFSGTEDTTITGNVLTNDNDADGDSLTVTPGTFATAHGSVVLSGNGSFTYTPAANYNGADSFTYTLLDGNGGSDTGLVSLTLGAVNDNPVANDDSAETDQDMAAIVNVLSNDNDIDGDNLTVSIATAAAFGALLINANQTITYTPDAGYSGADSFTYQVSDGHGGTDTATVSLTVNAVATNTAPVAVNDSFTGDQDTNITGNVLGNDSDPDGDALSVMAETVGTTNGSVTIAANGDFTYTPNTGYTGSDSFTYTLLDGNGGSDTANVSLTLNAVTADIVGTSSGETLIGTTGDDVIRGLGGNDFLSGEDGNDMLYGDDGNDTLKGRNGNDVMYGGDGVDYLEGGNDNDVLYGGLGADTLKGSAGVDTFVFTSMAEVGDTIQDFNPGAGEVINIADLLIGYDPLTDAITDFVEITDDGTNSTLKVDSDGGANNFVTVATLLGVTGITDESALETAGNLVTV